MLTGCLNKRAYRTSSRYRPSRQQLIEEDSALTKECKGPEWDALIDKLTMADSTLTGSEVEVNAKLNQMIADAGYDPDEAMKALEGQTEESWNSLLENAVVIDLDEGFEPEERVRGKIYNGRMYFGPL